MDVKNNSLPLLDEDLKIIQKLPDMPNESDMTAAELKAKFDEAGLKIKEYINSILLTAIENSINAGTTGQFSGEEKLIDLSVTWEKLADNCISMVKLRSGCVTTSKIYDGSVTADKLASKAVATSKIEDSAVTTEKINDAAITEKKIKDGAVKLSSKVTGTLSVAHGGTGATTASGALKNLGISYGTGDPPAEAVKGQIYFKKVT